MVLEKLLNNSRIILGGSTMSEDSTEEKDESWLTPEPEKTPWACEIEFIGKPSVMLSVLEFHIDGTRATFIIENDTIVEYPYDSISKIMILHVKR